MMFKIQRRPSRLALFLRAARYFFLVIGVVGLGYCAFVLLDQWGFQAYETWRFDRALKEAQSTNPQPASAAVPSQEEADRTRATSFGMDGRAGSPLGRMDISSIGLTAMIMEGVSGRTLQHAVGHIPGTALPGQQGNVALAAHRDTFFRSLRNIHKGDDITLTTLHGSFSYQVESTQVVEPDDIKVISPTTDDNLTLVACYPFYYVGPAPKRFIVRAHRTGQP